MRFLQIVAVLLALTLFFLYPPFTEQTDGECTALEQRIMDVASHNDAGALIVSQLYGATSSEPNGAAFAGRQYPFLPASLGCTIAYYRMVFSAPLPAAPATPPPVMAQPGAPPPSGAQPTVPPTSNAALLPVEPAPPPSMIARDITPNGDPISPDTTFTLPMRSVAIRAAYPVGTAGALRFQLVQGRAVLAACPAQTAKAVPGTAWCKFNVELRKGLYAITLTANNVVLGQYPFTVIGR